MGETFQLGDSPSGGDGTIVPDGKILEAEVVSVEKVVKPYTDDQGQPIVRVEFRFKVVDDEFENKNLWGDTPTTFTTHPDCKMRAWVQEILAVNELPKDFKLNTDVLVGARARISVAVKEYTDKDGEPQQRNYVSDVIRSREALASTSASQVYDPEPF